MMRNLRPLNISIVLSADACIQRGKSYPVRRFEDHCGLCARAPCGKRCAECDERVCVDCSFQEEGTLHLDDWQPMLDEILCAGCVEKGRRGGASVWKRAKVAVRRDHE
jgi:hypothetical protein